MREYFFVLILLLLLLINLYVVIKLSHHIPILKKMLGITPIDKQATTTPSTLEAETREITETPEEIKEEPKPKKNNNKKK